jgi:phosphatidate phosphatase LPIN
MDRNDMHTIWSGTSMASGQDEKHLDHGLDPKTGRSQSVPPELEGSPTTNRHELPKVEVYHNGYGGDEMEAIQDQFGAGGRLSAGRSEPTLFVVTIEGQKVSFELSLIGGDTPGTAFIELSKRSEVEISLLFEQGKVPYSRFIEDESIVTDERLVIRWANNQ